VIVYRRKVRISSTTPAPLATRRAAARIPGYASRRYPCRPRLAACAEVTAGQFRLLPRRHDHLRLCAQGRRLPAGSIPNPSRLNENPLDSSLRSLGRRLCVPLPASPQGGRGPAGMACEAGKESLTDAARASVGQARTASRTCSNKTVTPGGKFRASESNMIE
jgi:hypothetical protein